MRDPGSILGSERSSGEGNTCILQYTCLDERSLDMSHGQRSLADYSLWNHKESDTTEQLTHTHTLNMSENLENSAVVTGMEKVSFYFNSEEHQYQRIFKLLYNCVHFTC